MTYNQNMNNALTKQYDEILCSILNNHSPGKQRVGNHTSISPLVLSGSDLGEKQKETSGAKVA